MGHQSTGEWVIPLPHRPDSSHTLIRWNLSQDVVNLAGINASSRGARAGHVIVCDWSPAVSLYGRN